MSASGVAVLSGGTGFIGSRIARRLLADGWEVRLLSASGARDSLGQMAGRAAWYSVDDVDVARATEGATHYFNFAVVYDRATVSDETIHQVNVDLPRRVMDGLRIRGHRPVCVLGDSFFRKFPPEATAQRRYTRSKMAQWEMVQDLVTDGRIAAAMLRIEQVYGPGEALTKVFPSVVARMLRQEERIALTQGCQRRDFVHVDDVVEAALLVAHRHVSGASVVDCGTGIATPVREVFERLHALTRSRTVLGFGDLPADQTIDYSEADLAWLKREGWSPRIALDEGLRQLVEDVRARLYDHAATASRS